MLCALLVLAASGGTSIAGDGDAPPSPDEDAKKEHAALEREIAFAYGDAREGLEALGAWCDARGLFASRHAVADALLAFDGENVRAREWQRFKRQRGGSWKPSPWMSPQDRSPEAAAEWPKRRDAAASAFRARLEPLLERCGGWRDAGLRCSIVRALVDLWPEEEKLREMDGQVRVDGKWQLAETAATPDGRARLLTMTRAALAGGAQSAVAEERPTPAGWTTAFSRSGFGFVSVYPRRDTESVGAAVASARLLFEAVFETATIPRPCRVCLLKPEGNAAFLDAYVREGSMEPKDAEERRHFSTYWTSREEVVVAIADPDERADTTVRHAFNVFASELMPLGSGPAWIAEGVGTYLTYRVCGTRLTAFVEDTQYADTALARDVADAKADWIVAARKLVDRGSPPELPALLNESVNSMTKEDGLFAYALAAYFLESRPKDLRAILAAMKAKQPFDEALAETCGLDAEALERRLVRWMREVR